MNTGTDMSTDMSTGMGTATVDTQLAALHAALAAVVINTEGGRSFALAYSGGMDSRFLAVAARRLGYTPALLHVTGAHLHPQESACAAAWARKHRYSFTEVPVDLMQVDAVAHNSPDRCYACKRVLLGALQRQADPLPLADGSNADDGKAHRPGRRALLELGVVSPLAQAGLSKARIYALAAEWRMDNPNQPPRPCLLTRLPYHTRVNAELLQALAQGETAIARTLEGYGLAGVDFRLRVLQPRHCAVHMPAREMAAMPGEVGTALRDAVFRAAPLLCGGSAANIGIAGVETLSGFFDNPQTPFMEDI